MKKDIQNTKIIYNPIIFKNIQFWSGTKCFNDPKMALAIKGSKANKKRKWIVWGTIIGLLVALFLIYFIFSWISTNNAYAAIDYIQVQSLTNGITLRDSFDLWVLEIKPSIFLGDAVQNVVYSGLFTRIFDHFIEALIYAFADILWNFFFYPISQIGTWFQIIFLWMGVTPLMETIFKDNTIVAIFCAMIGIGLSLFIIMAVVHFANVALNKNSVTGTEAIRKVPKNVIYCILILLLLIPCFIIFNSIMMYLISFILNLFPMTNGFSQTGQFQNLPLLIYNCSFKDGVHAELFIQSTYYLESFDPIFGIIGQVLGMLILGYLCIYMLTNITQLIILWIMGWLTLGSVSSGEYSSFNNCLDDIKARFLGILGIYFSYGFFMLFLNIWISIPIEASRNAPYASTASMMLGLVVGWSLVLTLPLIFSSTFAKSKDSDNGGQSVSMKIANSSKNAIKSGGKAVTKSAKTIIKLG